MSKTEKSHMDKSLTSREAAEIIGYNMRTLGEWRKKGRGPKFFKEGAKVFYPKEEFGLWLEDFEKTKVKKQEKKELDQKKVCAYFECDKKQFKKTRYNLCYRHEMNAEKFFSLSRKERIIIMAKTRHDRREKRKEQKDDSRT